MSQNKRRQEKALQLKAVPFLEGLGKHWVVEKRHGTVMGKTKLPDLNCICYGLSCQLELKAPGEKPTRHQEHNLKKARAAGAIAMWADDMEMVKTFAFTCTIRCKELGLDEAWKQAQMQGAEREEEEVSGAMELADWPALNRERGELIDKSIKGTLTDAERARLELLQAEAERRLSLTRDTSVLDQLERTILRRP